MAYGVLHVKATGIVFCKVCCTPGSFFSLSQLDRQGRCGRFRGVVQRLCIQLHLKLLNVCLFPLLNHSQTGESVPPAKSEPSTPRNRNENSSSSEAVNENGNVEKQEDFADFSRFESFVEAQESVNGGEGKKSSPQPKLHKRSFSLDDSHVRSRSCQ